MGASFFVMLPVLISAILLFTGDVLASKAFLFISDLSQPDNLLGPINILPLVMTGITIVDAKLRFADDKPSQVLFLHHRCRAIGTRLWSCSRPRSLLDRKQYHVPGPEQD